MSVTILGFICRNVALLRLFANIRGSGYKALMQIPCQKHLFDIPDDITYLNCAYLSPSLKKVTEAGIQGVSVKAHPWKLKAIDFFQETEVGRELAAGLMGATADHIAIIPGVSYGIETAAQNVPIKRGQEILMVAEQYPSNVYPWIRQAKGVGAEIVHVDRPENLDWASAIVEKIHSNTAVVTLANCHWTDGSLIGLKEIREATRNVGAAFVLDLSQSFGAFPFDVKEVDPDFMATVGYKWLMGPFSLGFLYVSERYWNGQPLENNWIARKQSEDFAKLVEYRDEFQPGARRYDVAQRSNFALMPMAIEGLKQVSEWGVENIAETLSGLTGKVETEAIELGLTATPADRRVSHMIGIGFREGLPNGILDKLSQENVYVSVRGNSIRVAPHVYNSERDVDKLIAAIKKAL